MSLFFTTNVSNDSSNLSFFSSSSYHHCQSFIQSNQPHCSVHHRSRLRRLLPLQHSTFSDQTLLKQEKVEPFFLNATFRQPKPGTFRFRHVQKTAPTAVPSPRFRSRPISHRRPSCLSLQRNQRLQGAVRLRRLPLRIHRGRQAPAASGLQPRLPHRLHRHVAPLELHVSSLQRSPSGFRFGVFRRRRRRRR